MKPASILAGEGALAGGRRALCHRDRPRSLLSVLLLGLILAGGCYNHIRGNPVDRFHYVHTITVASDYSSIVIQTFLNRSHLKVGLRRESLYDGNRDGKLETAGFDRVAILDYDSLEDPPEKGLHSPGRLRDYDERFKQIIQAVKSGATTYTIEDRSYEISLISQNQVSMARDMQT